MNIVKIAKKIIFIDTLTGLQSRYLPERREVNCFGKYGRCFDCIGTALSFRQSGIAKIKWFDFPEKYIVCVVDFQLVLAGSIPARRFLVLPNPI